MIKVLIVDDHDIVRTGVRKLLERIPEMSVIGEADNGRSAVDLAANGVPDVVTMDIAMPGMNGIEATQRIVTESPRSRVLILSMHSDERNVAQAFKAGAKGYLLKSSAAAELVKGIQAVAAGDVYVCQQILRTVIRQFATLLPDPVSSTPLTQREREILQLIAEGNNAKSIAFILNLNVKTIDAHRQQIMKKLNLFSVAELTKYAVREGLTNLDL